MENGYFRAMHFKAWIENEVIHIIYTTDLLTIAVAKHVIETRLLLCKGLSYPVLTDVRSIKSDNPEARKYLANETATKFVTAGALLVNSQFHKVAGNFFVMVNKPAVPAKVFTDETEALKWLHQYKRVRASV